MSLLSVVQGVCSVIGVQVPTSVFASISANRTMQEMVALANEMAQRIAYDTREWREQKVTATFTGDGVATAFNLPPDYLRMLTKSSVWRSTNSLQPMMFIPELDTWNQRRARNYVSAYGEWTLLGNQMLIQPVMGVGVTATFAYLHKNCVTRNAGGVADTFVDDADTFRLPERLLKLGMTWQWKAQKGSPYADDLGTFSDALAMLMGANKPAPIIIGSVPLASTINAEVAYPWPVPTP